MKVTYIKLFPNKNKKGSRYADNNKTALCTQIFTIGNKENKRKSKKLLDFKFLKKSQVALIAISLMLMTAGYLNYSNNLKINIAELGDAKLVSTNISAENVNNIQNTIENNKEENQDVTKNQSQIDNNEEITQNKDNESNTETQNETKNNEESNQEEVLNSVEASTNVEKNKYDLETNSSGYFAQTKLERDTMYSQMLETYQKILENDKIPSDQKSIASNEIKNINDRKNAIAIIENLIKTKGFDNSVILINDNSINVVVKHANNLTQEQVAQIENIVSRELKASIEDIHITTKS